MAFVAFSWFLSPAWASLSAPRDAPLFNKELSRDWPRTHPQEAGQEASGAGQPGEFVITDETEVTLDGCACCYKDVPSKVSIKHLEVAADRKTVLKIDFRTRR
jgi:hypothetical protein